MAHESKPLNHDVYQTLKRGILSLEIKPGTALYERTLAAEMGVSRTPVREALQKLEADGLVRRYPNLGVVVTELLLRDVLEAFQLREFIEPPAAAIAARKLTKEDLRALVDIFESLDKEQHTPEDIALHNEADAKIHCLIVEATGNARLVAIMSNLNDIFQRARSLGTPARFKESIAEHKKLLESMCEGDSEGAREAMRVHLAAAKQRLIELI